jgi:hypothetical protein
MFYTEISNLVRNLMLKNDWLAPPFLFASMTAHSERFSIQIRDGGTEEESWKDE